MDLAGVKNGGVVGFKYFGFGGLAKHTKGIKPFEGTKQGDNTKFCINMTSKGKGAFRVRVMLDGPYANSTWNGKEIAVVDVPANAAKEATTYEVAVPAVEGLTGKHAIYLVVEGAGNEPLVDFHGIGFAKAGKPCQRPAVPTVSILVDGKAVAMPTKPIFSTNDNGLMDLTNDQVYAPLKPNSTIMVVTNGGSVKREIGKIVDGRATVRCTFNGKEKVYKIN